MQLISFHHFYRCVENIFDARRKVFSRVIPICQYVFDLGQVFFFMFRHQDCTVSVRHIGRRHFDCVRESLCINGYMALDSRDFFAPIISFLLCCIGVFNALRVYYAKACFLAPTIVGTDLCNHFFLTPGQVCSLAPPSVRSRFQSRSERFSTLGSRSAAFSIGTRFLIHTALRKIHRRDPMFSVSSSFSLFQGVVVSFETVYE
jgi:hypothetical protein